MAAQMAQPNFLSSSSHRAPPSYHCEGTIRTIRSRITIDTTKSSGSISSNVDVHESNNQNPRYSGFVLLGTRERHLCCTRSSNSGTITVVERATARKSDARLVQLKDSASAAAISEAEVLRERSSEDHTILTLPLNEDSNSNDRDHNETQERSKGYAKLDPAGRLRTPRAARELALGILYAAMASKLPPMRIFEDRMRRKEAFVKASPRDILEGYDLLPADGAPLFVQDEDLANKLEAAQEEEAIAEAAVLTAPLTFVYNRFVLRMAQRILKTTSERWLLQEPVLKQLIPIRWKEEKGRLIERCILHMAIAEIESIGTTPNIVINEAVELAKRMCDGLAPRVINGCLGSYCRSRHLHKNTSIISRELEASVVATHFETSQTLLFSEDLG